MTAQEEVAAAKLQALRLEAEHAAALVTRWRDAWDLLAPEYEDLLTDLLAGSADDTGWVSPRLMRTSRLEKALEHTRELLRGVTGEDIASAAEYALPMARAMVDGAGNAIAAQLPAGHAGIIVRWDHLDTGALDAIFERTTQQITVRSWPLADDITQVMKRELTRGVVVGDNPRTTAQRMTKQAGQRVNWGRNRALNIARTEMLDAARAAQHAQDAANSDVLRGWQWLASLDRRECIACLVMHGTFHPLTEPGPEGHPSCRCARVPVTKSWAELGIPGMEEDPLPVDPAAGKAHFDSLTPDSQAAIMGSASRLQGYKTGALEWEELAVRKKSKGWRDSYVPRPMPRSTRKTRTMEVTRV